MPGLPTFASSCLIAMALKNSKTGSLPVSEIYSFMKEHFPYFKVRSRRPGWGCQSCSDLSLTVRPRNVPRLSPATLLGPQLCPVVRMLGHGQKKKKKSRKRRGYLGWALTVEEELTRYPRSKE